MTATITSAAEAKNTNDRHAMDVSSLVASCHARRLAEVLASLKRLGVVERALYDGILRGTLAAHPRTLGVWSVWEPDALDGRDAAHAGTPGHDETGRYIPLWTRGAGAISVEPNSAYDTGEWYVAPMRERCERVVDPYEYPIAGARRLITTQVAPIVVAGVCLGVAGVDFAVEQIPGAARGHDDDNPVEELLDRGFVFLEADDCVRVAWCSPRSRRLLGELGGSRGSDLPTPLRRRLAEMRWPERGAGDEVIFARKECEGKGDALRVLPFAHPDTGPGLLLARGGAVLRGWDALSAREREVLSWMSEGKSNAEVATILGLSVHTVKRHVEKVLHKLGAPNRSAAAIMCLGLSTYRRPAHDAATVA